MSERWQKGESEQPPAPAQPAALTRPSVKPVVAQPGAKSAVSRPPPPPLPARSSPPQQQPTPSREVRLHVSVKASVRDPNLFIVRPLAEGQRPPAGTREAYLLLLEVEGPPNSANGSHHER